MGGFEPPTSRPQTACSSQTELHPVPTLTLHAHARGIRCAGAKGSVVPRKRDPSCPRKRDPSCPRKRIRRVRAKGSLVPAQKDPSCRRKRIRRARAKGSVVPAQKDPSCPRKARSVIPALAAGISPYRAPSIALVSHISPSPLRSSRRSTNLPAPSRISAAFECRLGGCTGLCAELGEIPAASAGMTDLALRGHDGSSFARV